MTSWQILEGDCRASLLNLPAQSVQTCVTSPPYFGLRDYGTGAWEGGDQACEHRVREDSRVESSTLGGGKATTGHQREGFKVGCPRCGARRVDRQIGLEPTPDEFVHALVETFREVRRVLADDGTLWLNLGDSYNAYNGGAGQGGPVGLTQTAQRPKLPKGHGLVVKSLKSKDLIGIPWMVAFALRADGWFLRSDIIWAKPNPMPESVTDRPTKAHEYLFLLTKSPRYFYDADAIREPSIDPAGTTRGGSLSEFGRDEQFVSGNAHRGEAEHRSSGSANKRTIWTVSTQPYSGAHFATFPPKLIDPCILAGSREGDIVLDPFAGAGTTGVVALRRNRAFVGLELNPEYAELARNRIRDDAPLLNVGAEVAA